MKSKLIILIAIMMAFGCAPKTGVQDRSKNSYIFPIINEGMTEEEKDQKRDPRGYYRLHAKIKVFESGHFLHFLHSQSYSHEISGNRFSH